MSKYTRARQLARAAAKGREVRKRSYTPSEHLVRVQVSAPACYYADVPRSP